MPAPHNPRLFQRGRIWWCVYYIGKKRVRESTRCTSYRAAEAYLKAAESGVHDPASVPASPHSVTQAIDWLIDHAMPDRSPSTRKSYRQRGGHVVRVLGDLQASALKRSDVQQYIAQRTEEEAHPHTIGKELTVLRCALREAKARQLIAFEPESIVPAWKNRYTPRKRVLEQVEIDKVLQTLIPHRAWWVQVALNTGGRASEVEGLRWELHFDWEGKQVHLPGTKTNRAQRWVPMSVGFEVQLQAHRKLEGPVVQPWPSPDADLKRAAKRAGIAKFTFNDLRRSFASHMVRAGVPLKVVAELMGHTSTTMVDRVYGHLAEGQKREAVVALATRMQTTGTQLTQSDDADWAKEP